MQRPALRMIHGINDGCAGKQSFIDRHFPGFDAKCIESGRGQVGSFEGEISRVCNQLNEEEAELVDGFTLFGISQGALIARGVLQRCHVGRYVKRFISMGGPHQGVAIIPRTQPSDFINTFIHLCRFRVFQWLVGPCGYIRDLRLNDPDKVRNVLTDLNNEFEFNSQYKDRMRNLNLYINIAFKQDEMVQPYNSSIFGYFKDSSYASYIEMEDTKLYKEDLLGLRELYNDRRLFLCEVEGRHLELESKYMKLLIEDLADWSSADYTKNLEAMKQVCRFKLE